MQTTDANARSLTDRQRAILETIERQGFVTVEGLAGAFGVSPQTVRRDIITLDRAGLLQRFHGGAGSAGGRDALRLGHARKQAIAMSAKQEIARRAAALIPVGSAIFLDVGTTVEAAAEAFNGHESLQVFTNSLLAALRFDHHRHDVQVLGGRLAGQDGSLVGEDVIRELSRLRLDFALIGCSGIEPGGRVMDFDLAKIAVKRAAMDGAAEAVLLATAEKFGRSARSEIAPLSAFAHVVTEGKAAALAAGARWSMKLS